MRISDWSSDVCSSDLNGADFASGTPNPRNSASAPNVCAGGGQPVLTVANVGLAEGNSGNTAFDFVLSLSEPAGEGGVSFDVSPSENGRAPGREKCVRTCRCRWLQEH